MNEIENLDDFSILDELERDSTHDSDVESNIGEEFEVLVHSEIDRENNEDSDEENEDNEQQGAVGVDDGDESVTEDGDWREWKAGDSPFIKFQWSNNSGYKPPHHMIPNTPLDYFQLFFTDELLNEIVKETNRYANEKIMKHTPLRKRSIWWTWKDLTLEEMKAFLGVLINMAMNPKPEIEDYFSVDWLDYQPFFKDVLSKDRFNQIFWNLHVSPPPQGPAQGTLTRFGKVRNVVLYLDRKFREHYIPRNKVSIDESTIGFKGKVLFKVYNKDKPVKWGIKIFVLSESCSGYICALEPYFGKNTTSRLERQDLSVTSRIVLHLVNKIKSTYGDIEGLHVFCDRYYTNLEVAKELYDLKVHITGTIMKNRLGLPDQVRPKTKKKNTPPLKLKKGDIKSFRKEDKYHVLLWKDSNDVTMLSTLYDNTTQTVRRIVKNGIVEDVIKPTMICKYNQSMGGVDIADQYISSYAFTRKSVKWWRKVFFWLLETAIVNAYLLYNMNQGQGKERQRKFRKDLVRGLVGNVRNSKKRGRPSDIQDDERLNGKLHVLDILPYAKDCCVCSDRGVGGTRKRTKYCCKTCTSNPVMCVEKCFEKYHTSKKLKD